MNQEQIQYCIPENIQAGIYKIIAPDDAYYIGSSKKIKFRITCHINSLLAKRHCNPVLQNKFNKYTAGWKVVLLQEITDITHIKNTEQIILDEHFGKPGCMNCNPSVNSYPNKNRILQHGLPKPFKAKKPRLYKPLTEKHKKSLSLAKLGKKTGPHSLEWCRKISEGQKGKKLSPETIAKRQATRAAKSGFKRTKESILKQITTRKQKGWFVAKRLQPVLPIDTPVQ